MIGESNISLCVQVIWFNTTETLRGFDLFGARFANVHGYLSLGVCVFGFLSNIGNIVVLTRPLMRSPTNFILVWLAVADLLTMVIYTPSLIKFYIFKEEPGSEMVTVHYPWIQYQVFAISFLIISHAIAVWLTVLLATVRFIHIRFPSLGPSFANQNFTNKCLFAIVFCCNVVAIPNMLIIKSVLSTCRLKTNSENMSFKSVYRISEDKKFSQLSNLNFWFQAILYKMLPSLLLCILTILLIVEMKSAGRRRDALKGNRIDRKSRKNENRTTSMLMSVVLLFLMIETPQGIILIANYSNTSFYNNVYKNIGDFIDFLTLLNEAANFLLYTSMSKQFRMTFSTIFCFSLFQSKRTRGFEANHNGPNIRLSINKD